MTRMKKFTLAALLAFALAAGAAASAPTHQLAGDPSQWGIESVAKKGSFDITERVAKKGSFDITERVAKKGSFDITDIDAA